MPLTAAMLEELSTHEGLLKFFREGFSGEFSSFSIAEKQRCFRAMAPIAKTGSAPALQALYDVFLADFSAQSCKVIAGEHIELLNAKENQSIKNALFLIAISTEKEVSTYAILTWLFHYKIFPSASFVYHTISRMLKSSDNNGAPFLLMTLHTMQENNPVLPEYLKTRATFFMESERHAALQAAYQETMRSEELCLAAATLRERLMSPIDATLHRLRAEAAHRHLRFQFATPPVSATAASNTVADDELNRALVSL